MSAVYGLTMYYSLCPSVLKYLSTWVYNVLFSLSRRTQVYTVYEFTMYHSLCQGVLKYLSEYMVLQCTVFSVQAYEFTMYHSLCQCVLKYLSEYMGLQCNIFSVQADSSVYSLWVYSVQADWIYI